MKYLLILQQWWDGHGTKILGTASMIVAGLLMKDHLVPAGSVRDVLELADIVLGALTVQRGFTNSNAAKP
jgi:hypothetical protein